jgi:hypothetical protein
MGMFIFLNIRKLLKIEENMLMSVLRNPHSLSCKYFQVH